MTTGQRFDAFLGNLMLTSDQRNDGITKHTGVRQCLSSHYYGTYSTSNSMLIGSWGKSTEIRPPRDIDVLFVLPSAVYERFQSRPGNKQSQLLQEVKSVLQRTYWNTEMRGDGQVVMVPFVTYAIEVAPAFLLQNGQYFICDTNEGGRYKSTDPVAEINLVATSNSNTNGNTRDLIRMLKRWQEFCNVPLRSFLIELLASEFLSNWAHRGKSSVYYDWMVRDFLTFLLQKSSWSLVWVPGTLESIAIGNDWRSRAETAQARAAKACEYEGKNLGFSAGDEWQKIFGTDIPRG